MRSGNERAGVEMRKREREGGDLCVWEREYFASTYEPSTKLLLNNK